MRERGNQLAVSAFRRYSVHVMPIIKSAKKALRSAKRKRVYNVRRQNAMNDITKKLEKLVKAGQKAEAVALVPSAYKAIDKAAKKGVIKKNTAARRKSRVASITK